MPMWPKPRGSAFPLWYFWSASFSVPQLLHLQIKEINHNHFGEVEKERWSESKLTVSVQRLLCVTLPTWYVQYGYRLVHLLDSRSPKSTARIWPRENQVSATMSCPTHQCRMATMLVDLWHDTSFAGTENPCRAKINTKEEKTFKYIAHNHQNGVEKWKWKNRKEIVWNWIFTHFGCRIDRLTQFISLSVR